MAVGVVPAAASLAAIVCVPPMQSGLRELAVHMRLALILSFYTEPNDELLRAASNAV